VSASLAGRLRAGTMLGAEGYVFELERRGYIKAGPFVPEVVLDFPDAVRQLHREFRRAGADVMVALTYYAHREKLRDVGREGDLEAMNRQAVRIARSVAAESSADGGALVAGNVCNTWAYDPDDPATFATVRAMYTEQLGWAAEEGVDFVISETNDYLAEVMVALTYYAHREKLRDVGREDDLEAMNRQAVRIAREVAREGDALVAGNVCNTWAYDPDDPATAGIVRAMYTEQLGWAAEEGVDFVISETNDYLGEALIALEVIQDLGLPAMVTMAPTQPRLTRDGYEYADACRILAAEGAAIVGLNCDRGPRTMLPLIARIRETVECAVAVQPVPYRTDAIAPTMETLRGQDGSRAFPIALYYFTCTRFDMAQFAAQARDLGVNYVGICCGAGPHHVRAMAEALGREVPASKYSPSMDLHPMFRADVLAKDAAFLHSWNA
jgi:betaine-homocysteine S-methyltransferase